MNYTQEQIQEFKLKDVRLHKSGQIKSYVENHGELPTKDWVDKAIALIYSSTEQDKMILNPNYVPDTKDGAPFDEKKPAEKQTAKESLNEALEKED